MIVNRKTFVMALVLVCMLAMLPLQAFAAKKSITLNKSELTVTVGKSKTLKATVTGPSSKVTWKSSKAAVASVDSAGKITAKKAGKTTITAKANGKTAKCVVTVEKVDYKELYRKFLEKKTVKAGKYTITPKYFYVLNIDRKDVPELVIVESSNTICTYYVYTVKDGKVKYLGEATLKGMSTEPSIWYVKKYKGIYVGGWVNGIGGAWEGIYSISGSKLKMSRYAYSGAVSWGSTKMEYRIGPNEKTVTKAAFNKYCKKYLKYAQKYETLKMYYNNAANREDYI